MSDTPNSLTKILEKVPLAPLGPGSPVGAMRPALEGVSLDGLGRESAMACRAGLWLAFGFLDESHAISQELPTREGSYWHGILHRREPDPSNAKYWFRRVGDHPVLELLAEQAPALGYEYEDLQQFVDFCERVRDTGTADEELAKRVQKLEWELLFDYCYRSAIGGSTDTRTR